MSRFASPLIDDRSTKRSKIASALGDMAETPEYVADIVADGNATLVLSGMSSVPETPIGLRVSTHALSLASPVFKALIASISERIDGNKPCDPVIPLPDDDCDAMYILANLLHLRNDKLPAKIFPFLLRKIALLAHKYQCVVAVGRATQQWFDRLYTSTACQDTWETIEAAYLFDEAMFFARFTSRWILQLSMSRKQIPAATTTETQKLGVVLADRHMQAQILLRNDLDALADTAAVAFSKQNQHYIDWAPGLSPEPDGTPNSRSPPTCHVNPQGAIAYLGALRDAQIWPSTTWDKLKGPAGVSFNIEHVVEKLKDFREPEYDDTDKCEFCDEVKISLTEKLDEVKDAQEKRLWGLCLDCYKAGGVNPGECRFDHSKLQVQKVQPDGLGMNGL